MKKYANYLAIIFIFMLNGNDLVAQNDDFHEPVNLNGPRFGITYLTPGELADKLEQNYDAPPYFSQFGWQFETEFFTLPSGTSGLVEGVLLIGAIEQNLVLPSGTFIVGIRGKNGAEFGFGPNLSLSGIAFAFAVGFSKSIGEVNFPVNLAVVPSEKGVRFSLLIGFNAKRRNW